MKAGMAAAVPLALAAVCHGDKSLCLQFDLEHFIMKGEVQAASWMDIIP